MDTLALADQIVQAFDPQSASTPLLKVGNKYVRHDEKGISTDNILINYAKEIQKNVEQALSSMDTQAFLATNSLLRPDEFNKIYSLYKNEAPNGWLALKRIWTPAMEYGISYIHMLPIGLKKGHAFPLYFSLIYSLLPK